MAEIAAAWALATTVLAAQTETFWPRLTGLAPLGDPGPYAAALDLRLRTLGATLDGPAPARCDAWRLPAGFDDRRLAQEIAAWQGREGHKRGLDDGGLAHQWRAAGTTTFAASLIASPSPPTQTSYVVVVMCERPDPKGR